MTSIAQLNTPLETLLMKREHLENQFAGLELTLNNLQAQQSTLASAAAI